MNRLKNNIGIDIGTSKVRFYKSGELVLETPPEIEINGKFIDDIIIESHIARLRETELFLKKHISSIVKPYFNFLPYKFSSTFTTLVSVLSNNNDIQLRACWELSELAGSKRTFMLNDCFILATGLGLDLINGIYMIVDFGAGKTSITTLQGLNIIQNDMPPVNGRGLDEVIKFYLRRQHHLDISLKEAEKLKQNQIDLSENAVDRRICISGFIKNTDIPKDVTLLSSELKRSIINEIDILSNRIIRHIENLEPFIQDKLKTGNIFLTGGSFKLKGLIDIIAAKIPVSHKSYQVDAEYMKMGFEKIQKNPDIVFPKMIY